MAKGPKDQAVSERLPVARVAVDISLAHLDRPFDYLVPARLDTEAVPGCRVRVRFAGQLVDGYLLERAETSEHQGRLARLERVISPEPVLTPEIFDLARAVADRYAGTLADVLRLAIPPRHATAEREAPQAGTPRDPAYGNPAPAGPAPAGPAPAPPDPGSWSRYPAGPAFLAGLAGGRPVRAAWSALPGPEWPAEIAIAAAATATTGRGVVIVVPDARDLDRVDAALTEAALDHVCLTADLGPAERYRRWLAVRRGLVQVVAGTRAAMFAPVTGLGLVVLWDDGDDLHAEPRAPYPNAREVLALRAHRTGAAALIGGFARTAELTQLVAGGWARPLAGSAEALRQAAPRVRAAPDEAELARDAAAMTARLPSLALRTARQGLTGGARQGLVGEAPGDGPGPGPVLVQVPRRGYLAAVACARCRAQARCATCAGPLEIGGSHGTPGCRWCGALAADWTCARCGSGQLRALVTGAARTAEELGRAFPGVPVRTSGGQHVLATVPAEPALVIATPGAEPVAPGRLRRRAAARRLGAARPAQPARSGGGPAPLAERGRPGPPGRTRGGAGRGDAARGAGADPLGSGHVLRTRAGRTRRARLPARGADGVGHRLAGGGRGLRRRGRAAGPRRGARARAGERGTARQEPRRSRGVQGSAGRRVLIRIGRRDGLDLARALHAAQATRSARKEGGAVRVQLDPAEVA